MCQQLEQKQPFASIANKVGSLISLDDVNNIFPIELFLRLEEEEVCLSHV